MNGAMMIRYGKSTQNAIAAMSCLAEVYDQEVRLSSVDIAKQRNLPQTLVAKLLTNLSRAGLLTGASGPSGGYILARPPHAITLQDIANVFERVEEQMICPFGSNWCGNQAPCPLHDQLDQLSQHFERFLKETTLDVFVNYPENNAQSYQI